MKKVHDDVLRAGKIFGQANAMYAKGHVAQQGREVLSERARRTMVGFLRRVTAAAA